MTLAMTQARDSIPPAALFLWGPGVLFGVRRPFRTACVPPPHMRHKNAIAGSSRKVYESRWDRDPPGQPASASQQPICSPRPPVDEIYLPFSRWMGGRWSHDFFLPWDVQKWA